MYMFSSGTTGPPKAAKISNRKLVHVLATYNVANMHLACLRVYIMQQVDRWVIYTQKLQILNLWMLEFSVTLCNFVTLTMRTRAQCTSVCAYRLVR